MKRLIPILLLFVLLSITAISQPGGTIQAPNHDPYVREQNSERIPLSYTHIREADVFWQKRIWRKVDLRQKMNHPFYYPKVDQNGRRSFMSVLFSSVKGNEVAAYKYDAYDSEFSQKLTDIEVTGALSDTIYVPVYEGMNIVGTDTIPADKKPEQVYSFFIKEEWFFDKQRSVLEPRIIGIAPIYTDDKGREKPMFWVYFPSFRPILAKSPVYNRFNDAHRLTYDDLFAKRMFSSYIIKESNVMDRYINEYLQGLDALLESEQIKDDMRNMENDLWEY